MIYPKNISPLPNPLPQGERKLSLPRWEGAREGDIFSLPFVSKIQV